MSGFYQRKKNNRWNLTMKKKKEKRILIVDDNKGYQLLLKKMIDSKGNFQVDLAVSARDAFATIYHMNIPYHTIITDISMESQLSGIHMLFQLRKYIKKFNIRVMVASTGFNYSLVMYITSFLFKMLLVQVLIPKKYLKSKKNIVYHLTDNDLKKFDEII